MYGVTSGIEAATETAAKLEASLNVKRKSDSNEVRAGPGKELKTSLIHRHGQCQAKKKLCHKLGQETYYVDCKEAWGTNGTQEGHRNNALLPGCWELCLPQFGIEPSRRSCFKLIQRPIGLLPGHLLFFLWSLTVPTKTGGVGTAQKIYKRFKCGSHFLVGPLANQ